MAKWSITDPRWIASAIGGIYFLAPTLLVLYVWATAMRPVPNHLLSIVAYYVVLCGLVAGVVTMFARGFTYRWTELLDERLTVHEGFYGLIWKHRLIPTSEISSVEPYDGSRNGMFGAVLYSGLRVRQRDGSILVLAECNGKGKYNQKAAELRRALLMQG